MMKVNRERAWELLKEIGFTRVSGSEQELKAANILLNTAKGAGFEGKIEPFEVQDGEVLNATLTVEAPYKKSYTVTGYKCAGNTPAEGLSAPFVYIGEVNEISLADVKGKFIMVNGRVGAAIYEKIMKAGAAGFITMSGTLLDTLENSDLDTRKIRAALAEHGLVPAVNIRMTDAMEMVNMGASTVNISLQTVDTTLTSHNVVVEVPGTTKPDEIIAIGAHYDSVDFTVGVYDNGAGSVTIMEMLHHFAANPPARTLRFVWFGSEEQGLLGSKAYLAAREDEIEKHIFMVNVDVGAIIFGRDMAGVSADKDLMIYIQYLAKELGFNIDVHYDIMSSDSSSFVDKGIPAVSFGRGGTRGAEFMHTRYDCLEFQSADVLANSIQFAGAVVTRLVNSVVFPVSRKVPDDIKAKTDVYFNKKPGQK